ncbi:MAG: DUF3990 domain-containing protein [Dysgonamonadaceae bacterium]|jgi:predicted nicotinamide N-methyase|nr:DUF3990 domain-containing protein [Dysgonamonadaceae bacterium]
MQLHHGSNQIIRQPDLLKGWRFLDFGSGFYLSDDKKQVENRAKSAVKFFKEGFPTINIYEFDDKNMSEQEATLAFYNTKLSENFNDEDNSLKTLPPYFIYKLWNSEKETGSYLNSQYISALT